MKRPETALIVGAGSGLSASLARLFAKDGMRVALAARDTSKLASLVEETGSLPIACDAAELVQVEAMFAAVEAKWGVPDLVVYNAGYRVRGPLVGLDPKEVERTIRVTGYAGFLVAQGAEAHARARVGRRVLHRRVGERKGLRRIGAFRHGQVRAAGACAEHGAGARAQGNPRRALRHRRRDLEGRERPASARARRGRDAPPRRNREELPARIQAASEHLDLGSRAAALGREVLERGPLSAA